ncbi:MAG: hypothetical protein E6J34_19540, partial [Chloroflexi bacterium]
ALVAACATGIMDMETAFGFLLAHWGVTAKVDGKLPLHAPQMRMIAGSAGRPVETQEALSRLYWEKVLSEELNSKKGMESLYKLGYTHFLQTGPIDDTDYRGDLFLSSGIQYFPSVAEIDPWRTLTNTLANLYCLGLDIDWSGFEQGNSRRKVVLPTYPFQRNYFWCETARPPQEMPLQRHEAAGEGHSDHRRDIPCEVPASNPLDGRITNSLIKTKQIEYCLNLDDVPDVKDTHGVLHVGYFLEMLRRAVKSIYQTTVFHIQTINFLTAVIIPESGAVTLSLALKEKESGELDFSFFSHQGDDNWNKHVQGTLQLNNIDTSPQNDAASQAEIISRCTDQYSGAQFYQQLQARELFLGERVQWLDQIWSREGEALARLRLPRSLKTSHEYEREVHPGVFEACAQLFHAALSRSRDADMRYMVTAWENFVCHKPSLDQTFWCHVVLQDGPQRDGQLKGRFRLLDENGTVIAQISNGVMKGLNKKREDAFRNYLEASEKAKERKSKSKIICDLRELRQDQWRGYLNDYLQQVFAPILRMEVSELSGDEALTDVGMDSIMGMEAKTRLEEELDIFLPIELFIVEPSIAKLTESIIPLLAMKPSQGEKSEIRKAPLSAYKMDNHSWIVHRKPNPQARVKLFCLPYGGGRGASSYREWQAMLPDYVEVCPVQLPGKGNRMEEKAFTDIGRATEILKQVLHSELDCPYAFYGHSVGALLAYRLAYKFWSEIDKKPGHLFVGAYSSPTILPNPVISLAQEKFKEIGYDEIPDPESLSSITLEKRDEIAAALLSTVGAGLELQRIFLPTALAELQMVRGYNIVDKVLFDVPITAIHGRIDDKVREHEMNAWQELTKGPFTLHTLPGNHLFLHENQDQEQLLELISHGV